jgi:hypothetical protein
MWLVSGVAGALAALLAGSTGYLMGLLGNLLWSGEEASTELEAGEVFLALPRAEKARAEKARTSGSGSRPLAPEFRERFQDLHRSVQTMVKNWPTDLVLPLERRHLEAAPDAFRDLAHLREEMRDTDPGFARVERRLQGIEEQVGRLRKAWSLLVSQDGQSEALELLETTGDALEALMEVDRK